MFEPDGRNSVQYVGHLAVQASRIFLFILAIIIVTPLVIFLWCHWTIRAQREDVRLWVSAPAQYVTLDFNHPGVRLEHVLAQARYDTQADLYPEIKIRAGLAPALYSFPAGLRTPGGLFPFEPVFSNLQPYFWYNLPVAEGTIHDLDREHSPMLGGHDLDVSAGDPWKVKGVWNTAPDRNWDAGSGELYLRAKATSNFAAYAQAVDTVARVKVWVLGRSVGRDLSPDLTPSLGIGGGGWLVPAQAVYFLATHGVPVHAVEARERELTPTYARLVAEYNELFSGQLPVVTLKLQVLDALALGKANPYSPLFRKNGNGGSWANDFAGLTTHAGLGPFIIGMTVGTAYDRVRSDPSWSAMDFFWNRTPEIAPGSAEAQAALLEVSRVSYWQARLAPIGLGDETSISQLKVILDGVAKTHAEARRLAKLDGHHHYNFDANSFNPLRQDLDRYNPHDR